MACPQNRGKYDYSIGGFLAMVAFSCPACPAALAMWPPLMPCPKKQSTCSIGGLLWCCAPQLPPVTPPPPLPLPKKAYQPPFGLFLAALASLPPLMPPPKENNLLGLWPPMMPCHQKIVALEAVFLWWGQHWRHCLLRCHVPQKQSTCKVTSECVIL